MSRIKSRGYHLCERCHCSLDAGEGRFCAECREEIRQEEAHARRWSLTMEQARELREQGLIDA